MHSEQILLPFYCLLHYLKEAFPYSDLMSPNYESSLFGSSYPIIANFLFWIWFINFNVGIFNALPIGPLDGGQLYGIIIRTKIFWKEVIISQTIYYVDHRHDCSYCFISCTTLDYLMNKLLVLINKRKNFS